MMAAGERIAEKFFTEELHGARPTPARSDVFCRSASSVPPPPIEWPVTPRRLLSTLPATGPVLSAATVLSAACNCVARLAGWSSVELVLMVTTTNPWVASRRPIAAIDDCVAVKPGQNATRPYVPAAFGEYTVPPPKPLPRTVCVDT